MKKNGVPRFCVMMMLFFCCVEYNFGQDNNLSNKKENPVSNEKTTGFYNVTTFSPVTFTGQFLSGAQTICGYKVNSFISIGGGTGYEQYTSLPTYDDFKASLSQFTLFADLRYTPLKGKCSPVIAVDGGYKFLLNKPSTQVRYYSAYGDVDGVSSRNDYSDYNVYSGGGPFITAEAGVRYKICKHSALFLSVDYSLWSVSGTYYLTNKLYLLNADNNWINDNTVETTNKSLAYVHVFIVRLGIVF